MILLRIIWRTVILRIMIISIILIWFMIIVWRINWNTHSIIIMDQNTFMNFPTNKTIRKIFKSRNCYQTRVQVQKSSNLEQICKLQQIRDLLAKLSKLKVLEMVWWKQRSGGGEEKHVSLC
ncbi:hypothetical protein TorRG33x02_329320, partial [Trema orientale]